MAGGREQLVRWLTVSSCWKVCFGVSAASGTGSGDKFGQRQGLPANFEMIIQVRLSETIFVPFSPPHRGCGVRTTHRPTSPMYLQWRRGTYRAELSSVSCAAFRRPRRTFRSALGGAARSLVSFLPSLPALSWELKRKDPFFSPVHALKPATQQLSACRPPSLAFAASDTAVVKSRSLGSRFHALRLRVPLPLGPLLTHTAQQVRSGASKKVFASFRGERSGRWSFKPVRPLHHHALLRYSRPLFAAAAAAAPNAAFPPTSKPH